MPQEPDEIEVAQKFNAQRLLQSCLEAAQAAPTPARACLALVRLYTDLSSLRRLDASFEAAWGRVLGGRLVQVVASRRAWRRLTWAHVAAAQEVLMDLMDRHGMGFQAALEDQVERFLATLEAELEGTVADLEAEAPPEEPEARDGGEGHRVMEPAAPEEESPDEDDGVGEDE